MLDLARRRKVASESSQGISAEPIYSEFEKTLRDSKARGVVVDFGAGRGLMARRLFETAVFESVIGVDLMERPAELDTRISWLSQDLNDPLSLEDSSVDTIVAPEIIEHLENPRMVAREWFRILRKNGHLYLSTPNCESIRAMLSLLIRGHYVSFLEKDYPAHITPLLQKDLERILGEAGFTDIRASFVAAGRIPKVTRLTWQQISFGLLRGKRFTDTLFVSATKSS